ncbi:MAG: hypothetical protein FWE55_01725 [Synergistaceae bacterium]|nr:hypothetical protein [Synergistaceae bacterium]
MKKPALSPSSISIFIAVMAALFAMSAIVASREKEIVRGNGAGPGVFSTSAVGYAGFFQILGRMEVPVLASTSNPLHDAEPGGTLIIGEPILYFAVSGEESTGKISKARRLLLILPKWHWEEDPKRREWVSGMSPHDISYAQAVLALVSIDTSRVIRAAPPQWRVNEFNFTPEIEGVTQLIKPSEKMRTLVGGEEGALLVEFTGDDEKSDRAVWILSDPDVLSNHGIWRGENAAFMISVVESLSAYGNDDFSGRRGIIFDETVHGFMSESSNSIVKMMMKFPYAVITILTILSAILLVFAGMTRFGAPQAEKPALDFGKALLIDNGARLLDYGGHHSVTLERYTRFTMSETAKALHAPDGLEGPRLAEWLDRVGESRKVSISAASILDSLTKQERSNKPGGHSASAIPGLMETARNAHRWKNEILRK